MSTFILMISKNLIWLLLTMLFYIFLFRIIWLFTLLLNNLNYELFDHKEKGKKIFLVDMKVEATWYFSELASGGIEKYYKEGKRIAIILNKKWFSSGVICQLCWHIPQCNQCDVSIAYHQLEQGDFIWLCHICKTQYSAMTSCPDCRKGELKMYGLGIQQAAQMLKERWWIVAKTLDSSQVNSLKKIKESIKDYAESQVVIGTELLTTPIIGRPFDLVVYLDADLGLNIPDFSAAQKNFAFLYNGLNHHSCSQFVVQSYNPDNYSIRAACKLDPVFFAKHDDEFRSEHLYPPYGQVCVLLYKHQVEQRLHTSVSNIYKELLFLQQKYEMMDLEIYTTPPIIYKIYGKYRYNVILKWKDLRPFMDIVYSKLNLHSRWFKVDWDARSVV